jgi:hypothetical protein
VPRALLFQAIQDSCVVVIREKEMAVQICYGEHSGHICVMAIYKKFEEIKAVTKNPQYICLNCGRVADAERNLCNPGPLK